MVSEGLQLKTHWTIGKFRDPDDIVSRATKNGMSLQEAKEIYPEAFISEETIDGNLAVTIGIQAIIYWMCNGAGGGALLPAAPSPNNLFNNANARLVTGTGAGAAAQTDVYTTFTAGVFKAMDALYPNMSAATPWVVTWQATYASGDANQAWNEFGVCNYNGTGATVLLNRVVSAKGTKVVGETWVLQISITFA